MASTVNASEMNKAKISSVDLRRKKINFSLTERMSSAGKYWPKVVAVRTEG